MRSNTLILFSILSFHIGCTREEEKTSSDTISTTVNTEKNASSESKITTVNDSTFIYHEYKSDDLSINITNHQCATNYTIEVIKKSDTLNLDLNSLKIPFQTPEVSWVSSEMICIANWYSGPFSRYIFIPLRGKLQNFIYIDKDIEYADSSMNNIVYVETIDKETRLVLTVENLISRRAKSIEIEINSGNNEYPYYDSLTINSATCDIWANRKKYTIDLTGIN